MRGGDGYLPATSFAGSQHYRVPALLLYSAPVGPTSLPGRGGSDDHGGYFYHGEEQIVGNIPEHPALVTFRKQYYGGRTYASELARRGFVVLVIDAFYWGERRLQYRQGPPDCRKRIEGLKPDKPSVFGR